jgi:lysophospholipid acyltransferase (LPLAT)-like uncharacterized protein
MNIYESYKKNKRKLNKKLNAFIAPFLGYLYINFVHLTSRKQIHFSSNLKANENYVLLCWHNKIAMFAPIYLNFRTTPNLKCIISTHNDGLILKKFASYFGFSAISGSSNRGGVSVIINGLKFLKLGYDVLIAPDGPRGPAYSVAVGAVALAQKTNTKLIAFSFSSSAYWQLNSWDKSIIPKPFATLNYYIGSPFSLNNLKQDEAKNKIKYEMAKIDLDTNNNYNNKIKAKNG